MAFFAGFNPFSMRQSPRLRIACHFLTLCAKCAASSGVGMLGISTPYTNIITV
jgi:hypothetical protein